MWLQEVTKQVDIKTTSETCILEASGQISDKNPTILRMKVIFLSPFPHSVEHISSCYQCLTV